MSKTRRVPYPGTVLYYIYIFIYTGTRVLYPGQLLPYIPGYPGTRFCTRIQYPVHRYITVPVRTRYMYGTFKMLRQGGKTFYFF